MNHESNGSASRVSFSNPRKVPRLNINTPRHCFQPTPTLFLLQRHFRQCKVVFSTVNNADINPSKNRTLSNSSNKMVDVFSS